MLTLLLVAAFVAMWTALYLLVLRPKLRSFRYTAGIYAALDNWENTTWAKVLLLLKGIKVAIVGVVTSSLPVLIVAYEQASAFDWTKVVPSEKAQIIVAIIALVGFLGPILMVILHQGAIADAAAGVPVDPTVSK